MKKSILFFVFAAASAFGQISDLGISDHAEVLVGRHLFNTDNCAAVEGFGSSHPFHVAAFHPDGTQFYHYDGCNLRTTAGINWQGALMGQTTTPSVNAQCNYIALTNTAITPAMADTTLSGEIVTNGLSRTQATYTLTGTTLSAPAAATATVVGTTGAVTYYYWVAACAQGICTTPSLVSNTVSTANATLSTTNYVSVAFTGQAGAATYQLYRTTTNVAPSGTVSVLVGGNPACSTAYACTWLDQSNSLSSVTIPGSNLTAYGAYTLGKTLTATGAQSAQAFGIFTAASSGTMCFEGTFTPVSLNTNDTLSVTETVNY